MPDVVTFDPIRRLIVEIDTGGDNEIDINEIYGEWKDWYAVTDNSKWPPALRTTGGDPITDVQNLGATFFLINNWRFKPAERDHRLSLVGNWFTDPSGDFTTIETDGNFTVLVSERVSNLTDASVSRLDLAQLQESVYIDTVNGNDTTGTGTPTAPFLTIGAAYTQAVSDNLRKFSINGAISLDRDYEGWGFSATNSLESASVDINGFSIDNSDFKQVILSGSGSGRIDATKIRIGGITGISGYFENCGLGGLFSPADGTKTTLAHCFSDVSGNSKPILDLGDLIDADLQVRDYWGGLDVRNIDVATQTVSIDFIGRLAIGATNTLGDVVVGGLGVLDNTSSLVNLNTDSFIDARDIELAKKVYANRQKIDINNNELLIYDDDEATVLYRYDLLDGSGSPTSTAIFERVPKAP